MLGGPLKLQMVFTDPCGQFHQRFTREFYIQKYFQQLFLLIVTREKLPKRRLYKKFARKMLMKLTPDSIVHYFTFMTPWIPSLERMLYEVKKLLYELVAFLSMF
jgi:hypothetical protein